MPYYEANEPYQRVDHVGNGALAGALLAGSGAGLGVLGMNKHYKNIDARMDAKIENLESKRSSIYEKARNLESNIDEKIGNMKRNPLEASRTTAGRTAQNLASAYYKPAYRMEANVNGRGNVVFQSAEEATEDRIRRQAARNRYANAVGNSGAYQWGTSQINKSHASYVNRQSKKREKLMGKVQDMRQSAHEMQGELNQLKNPEYRSGQKANHFYAKHLGGWKNLGAIAGAAAIGAVSGAFLDAAATPLETPTQ